MFRKKIIQTFNGEDGAELPLIADVLTPWEKVKLSAKMNIKKKNGVHVLSVSSIENAEVFSEGTDGIALQSL
nr:hypothetical protein [uncultured Desulfobacter sp.]